MKKRLFFFLKLIIGCALLAAVFWAVDLHNVTRLMGQVHIGYYLLSLVIFFLCWLINTMKWQLILVGLHCDVDFWTLLKFNFSSFYFALALPGGQATGELIKCYRVAKTGDNKSLLVLSVFMDRLTGLAGSVTLGIIGLIFSATILPNRVALLAVSIAFALLAAIFIGLLFPPGMNHWLVSLLKYFFGFSWFKNKFDPQAITKAGEAFKGMYGILGITYFFSLAFQFLGTVCLYYLAHALGLNINLLDLLWVYFLVSVILLLPVSLMGLGLREGSFVGLLALLSIPGYVAVSLSLLVFTVNLFAALCGGFMELAHYLFTLQRKK